MWSSRDLYVYLYSVSLSLVVWVSLSVLWFQWWSSKYFVIVFGNWLLDSFLIVMWHQNSDPLLLRPKHTSCSTHSQRPTHTAYQTSTILLTCQRQDCERKVLQASTNATYVFFDKIKHLMYANVFLHHFWCITFYIICDTTYYFILLFCVYTIQKFGVGKICFWKKSLLLTKAAFIWSKIQ